MKIYFTASVTHDGQNISQYREIISALKKIGVTLTSGEQIVSPAMLAHDREAPRKEIFDREKKQIEASDAIVAEVTNPSTGVGGEIVYALMKSKPVLSLFYGDSENKLSPMLSGNPSDNLYIEHYDDDNIEIKLKSFFKHLAARQNRKGKLIVIDGGDGSGKATQAELLLKYLKKRGINVKYLDFPRYYSSFYGKMVARYLQGEFGDVDKVSPYLISLAYAVDRAGAREEMNQWLARGGIIVTNRYTTTNLAYMSAKYPKGVKRDKFMSWIEELEYRIHRIPKEDIVVYLSVPPEIGKRLITKRGVRKYTEGRVDIHEGNLRYLKEVEKVYLTLIRKKKNWVSIDCVENGQILPVSTIHRLIIETLQAQKMF